MDDAEETMLKRGLYRLGTAKSLELSSFSGADVGAVDAYLTSRPDLVLPRQGEGPWQLRKEARETLMEEIKSGVERDPERLSDVLQPGFIQRVRSSLDTSNVILDELASGAIKEDRSLAARLSLMGKALREMRRHGRDVKPEEDRLLACEERYRAWLGGKGPVAAADQ